MTEPWMTEPWMTERWIQTTISKGFVMLATMGNTAEMLVTYQICTEEPASRT